MKIVESEQVCDSAAAIRSFSVPTCAALPAVLLLLLLLYSLLHINRRYKDEYNIIYAYYIPITFIDLDVSKQAYSIKTT